MRINKADETATNITFRSGENRIDSIFLCVCVTRTCDTSPSTRGKKKAKIYIKLRKMTEIVTDSKLDE